MKAINYYLVVEKIKEEPKKIAGLIMTEKVDDGSRYAKAKIISVGNLAEGLNEGDIIHYDKHAGHGITWKDKLYSVIKAMDVVLIE